MRRGFTISELLVVILVLAVLLAAIGPAARRLHLSSGQTTSTINLHALSLAHALYAAAWDGRQFTHIPDDFAVGGGSPIQYTMLMGCPPPLVLGFSFNGAEWGYWLPCHGTGFWSSISFYKPFEFSGNSLGAGTHRLMNAKTFNVNLGGRFYWPGYYAPNDTITHQLATPYFSLPDEFTLLPPPFNQLVPSSYAMSAAAMWDPAVLSRNRRTGLWWTDPDTFLTGYTSPTITTCRYPDLKTQTIEHNWNLGQPAAVNPAFAGGKTPYYFSHGVDAAPLTLFFDGHVAELPNAQVAADDQLVLEGTRGEVGLWTRDTPLGADGYFGAQSFDGFVTGHHVLTADGILGRDVLNAARPRGGMAERGRRAGTPHRPQRAAAPPFDGRWIGVVR